MDEPSGLLAYLKKRALEGALRAVGSKHIAAVVASIDHVITRAREFES